MSSRLRQHYLDYLAVLNDRRFDDLAGFVAGNLTYNGRPTTRLQYQRDREDEAEAIPDLRFNVGLLVTEGDLVACKLDFDCTPVKTFLGFEPSGSRIQFTEHVFYRFSGELIVAVTSLLDLAAIQRQVSGAR
jgi:predicted ester cyclase